MSDIFQERSSKYKSDENIYLKRVGEGLKGSTAGLLAGYEGEPLPEDAPWSESLLQKAGGLVGDLPAFLVGQAATGGLGGGFAAPELIRQLVAYKAKPASKTWTEALSNLAEIPLETGKQAIVGRITGAAGKVAPMLAKTGLGKEVAGGLGALTGMTGGQALMEGELPSPREVVENAMLLGAMHAAGAGARGLKKGVKKITPEPVRAKVDLFKQRAKTFAKKPIKPYIEMYKKEQPAYDLIRKHIGERNADIADSAFKWGKESEKLAAKLTPKQLEEMMYFRQRTGNPNVKGDTFEALAKRLPSEARNFVDTTIEEHFKKTLKAKNEHKYLKKISPRSMVEEVYLPHFYENPTDLPKKYTSVAKKFNYKDPMANMKNFLSYNQALVEAGMRPKYKNVFELMRAYDAMNAQTIAGANLMSDISKIEKDSGRKVIVNAKDPYYPDARAEGYTPIDSAFLRAYTPEGAKTPGFAPALVAPEFAGAFKGLFPERRAAPTTLVGKGADKFWKAYDYVADIKRISRVSGSLFHYNPLLESFAATPGKGLAKTIGGIFAPWKGGRFIMRQGEAYLNDPLARKDMAKHGLVIHAPLEEYQRSRGAVRKTLEFAKRVTPDPVIEKVGKMADAAWDKIPGGIKSNAAVRATAKGTASAVNKLTKIPAFLFEKFHPRLKAVAWHSYVNDAVQSRIAEGKTPSAKEVTAIKNQMADLVNNTFGGQNWDVQRFFNTPEARQYMRRVISYPDWTLSAIKQAGGPLSEHPAKARAALRYWMKFGINMAIMQSTMKFVFGGMYQSDKENKSVSGIRWDPSKAIKEFTEPDPLEYYKFPLPDIPVNIAGKEFNPGREQAQEWKKIGSKFYTHWGKQALEIKNWYYHPWVTFFSKSNPVLSGILKQVLEKTPGAEREYAVRGKYKKGYQGYQPWDATEPGTVKRGISRVRAFVEEAMPFSMRTLFQKGAAPYLATGLGSLPVSKGTTTHKAEFVLVRAFKKNDTKKINAIKRALKDNGYTEKQIKAAINKARRRAKS